MKLLTNLKMHTFSAITASSSAAGFPVSNLQNYDPGLIWKAASFAGSITIVIDLGAAVAIPQIWLNNANFVSVTLQANATDAWSAPSVTKDVTLASDDICIIKGFFDLSATNYRYVRIVIPVQALTDGDTVPSLGNIIIGEAVALKIAAWEPQTTQNFTRFNPDGGGNRKAPKGRARHIFNVSQVGTKAEIDASPVKGWSTAVIFTDLGDVADSYLIYPPESTRKPTRNVLDVEFGYALEELV